MQTDSLQINKLELDIQDEQKKVNELIRHLIANGTEGITSHRLTQVIPNLMESHIKLAAAETELRIRKEKQDLK